MSNPDDFDHHFAAFAQTLKSVIASHGFGSLTKVQAKALQAKQIKDLLAEEECVRKILATDARGTRVWERFVAHVLDDRGSVSQGQPFFRERQATFIAAVSPMIKARDAGGLRAQPFLVNRSMVEFALAAVKWPKNHAIRRHAKRAGELRNQLVELNLPLGVSQARTFWSRTAKRPGARLSFMDFVQIAAMGLLVAVDKFMPSADPDGEPEMFGAACDVFPSVAITRMKGFFIQDYSATPMHFSSADRRRLYRANKVLSAHPSGEVEFSDVVDAVNAKVEDPGKMATEEDVRSLIAAATFSSTDATWDREDDDRPPHEGAAPESDHPDVACDDVENRVRMDAAVGVLPLRDRKILRMQGVGG